MIRKILLGIFLIVFYFIFRDMFKARQKTIEILGKPRKKNIRRDKQIIEVDFYSNKSDFENESGRN